MLSNLCGWKASLNNPRLKQECFISKTAEEILVKFDIGNLHYMLSNLNWFSPNVVCVYCWCVVGPCQQTILGVRMCCCYLACTMRSQVAWCCSWNILQSSCVCRWNVWHSQNSRHKVCRLHPCSPVLHSVPYLVV